MFAFVLLPLTLFQVRPIFLPAYSPELNPCELCFSIIKSYMRTHCDRSQPLLAQLFEALMQVTLPKLLNFYRHCVTHMGGRAR
jgi:transposase